MAGLSDVQAFSPSKINELKIGYTRYQVDARPFFAGQALATQLGFPESTIRITPSPAACPISRSAA